MPDLRIVRTTHAERLELPPGLRCRMRVLSYKIAITRVLAVVVWMAGVSLTLALVRVLVMAIAWLVRR